MRGKRSSTRALLAVVCLWGAAWVGPQPARANDMVLVGSGGGWKPLKGEHYSVRMVSEKVAIDVRDESYLVTADFVFRNGGSATTVAMGFPESGIGAITPTDYAKRSGFQSFQTLVDGRVTPVRRTLLPNGEEEYNALWVKRVHFGKGQTRRVRVRYQSQIGAYSDGSEIVAYQFTGGNWSGDVAESVLTLRFRARMPGSYLYNTRLVAEDAHSDSPQSNLEEADVLRRVSADTLVLHRTHWQAQAKFEFGFLQLPPDWLGEVPLQQVAVDTPNSYLVVRAPRSSKRQKTSFARTTLGMQYGGRTLVNLHLLRDPYLEARTASGSKVTPPEPTSQMSLRWDARDKSLIAAKGKRSLRFWADKAVARREDGTLVPLGVKPLQVTHSGSTEWYVPLQPVLEILGATAEVKPQQHLLRLRYPKA